MIGAIILFVLLYFLLGVGTFSIIKTCDNPFHKFKLTEPDWNGDQNVIFRNDDDKFWCFIMIIGWIFIVGLYYIPLGIFYILKFLANFFGWCIAKIFKL